MKNSFCLRTLIFFHQDIRGLLKIEEEHNEHYDERSKLEYHHKVKPVKFHDVKKAKHYRDNPTE